MRKNKIWAASVNNLSVARYFAAMEVDIMSFSLSDTNNISKIHALREWIEGPQIGVELVDIHYSQETENLINEIQPDLILTSPFLEITDSPYKLYRKSVYPDYEDLPYQVIIFENLIADFSEFTSLSSEEIYIDGPVSQENLQYIKENLPHIGLLIRGGDEEKVGIKSFDELDEFFEIITEE